MNDITKELIKLRKFATANNIPVLREESAVILKEWLINTNPRRILEIGTSIGTSGILALAVAKNAYLVTIEKNEQVLEQARENFRRLNLLDRANLILGDCFETLMLMNDNFDFVIFDGPKGHNMELLDLVFPLLSKNGIIFVDNINYHSKVKFEGHIPHKHRTIVRNIRKFIHHIKNNKSISTIFYDDGDGIAIIKKLD